MTKRKPSTEVKRKRQQAHRLSKQESTPSAGRWLASALFAVFGLAVAAIGVWYSLGGFSQAQSELATALESASRGDAAAAERQAWLAWQRDHRLDDAAALAAEMAYRQERFSEAVQYASQVSDANPGAKLVALRLLAQIYHHKLHQLSDAERAYRAALAIEADDAACNEGLANLLGLCARRADAIPSVLKLVHLGRASDLLMLLARDDTIVNNLPALEEAYRAAPSDPLPRVGLAWHAAESGQGDRAAALLREALSLDPELICAHVALAKYYANAGQFDELRRWQQTQGNLVQRSEEYADTWLARGSLAEHDGDVSGAVRCYAEAALRAPDSKTANARLAQLLNQLNDLTAATRFADYARGLQDLRDSQELVFFASGTPRTSHLVDLISRYETLGRIWEAYGWAQVAVGIDPQSVQAKNMLQDLQRRAEHAPLQLVLPEKMPAKSLDLSRYPLPTMRVAESKTSEPKSSDSSTLANYAFRDDAQDAGLNFRFHNGIDGTTGRKMYEFTGGGIAVLDFDADGWPDVALTQGLTWPPDAHRGQFLDKLFRNVDGQHFEEVASFTVSDDGFGQGATAGDFDLDGFPDLYIAQIGNNRLLHNNGDGTFTDVTERCGISADGWTTSCVMADLNGDTFPDLYDVNYVQGSDVFERVCQDTSGHAVMCMPSDFEAAQDRLWLSDGAGNFRDETRAELSEPPVGKGLGAVAMDADGSGRLSLLVANDTTPNLWYVPRKQNDGRIVLQEEGLAAGLAFNADGKAQGCMGVAVADINEDGLMDMVVTNFYKEASTLYLTQGPGLFSDQTRAWGLRESSLNMLGFGTQFLDVDLDGVPELFVANGHVDELSHRQVPYEMEAQLFSIRNHHFQLEPASSERPYFQRKRLGRAVAKLDWNRDGREDLLVGDLKENYALLTNRTEQCGEHISMRLVGTRSSRDAVGARVEIFCGDRRLVGQLTAGDGYQASNERRLSFGIGAQSRVDRIVVHWPSGGEQELKNITAGSEVLVIEEPAPAAAHRP